MRKFLVAMGAAAMLFAACGQGSQVADRLV